MWQATHLLMRRVPIFLFLVACGGNAVPISPDSGPESDSGSRRTDAAEPILPPANDAGDDASVPMMPTPNGSILALARGQGQNDFLTVVRITLPSATVTPLWTFQPPNGMHARAIAMRPDGAIDRFDIENMGTSSAKTHIVAVSKATGMPVGQERVLDGTVTGADYDANGQLWAMLAQWQMGSHVVTIDGVGTVTTLAQQTCVIDIGAMAVLWHGCGEDVFWDDLWNIDAKGQHISDIATNILMWDAMTPMAQSYIALVDQYGEVEVVDPKTKLLSALLKTPWSYRDATEDL